MPTLEHADCRLAYDVLGDGPPVLFIQGTGVHGAGWLPQTTALHTTYSCLTFDNRGVGRSHPQGRAVSVVQMADDAVALVRALGWSRVHVVGHSLGGLVALQVALTQPAIVHSLALLCTFANGADATKLSASMLWTALRTRIGSAAQRRRAFLELVLPKSAWHDSNGAHSAHALGALFGHDLATQPRIVLQQFRAMSQHDTTSSLHTLAGIPTLVLSAELDRIAPPPLGRALAAAIPGARYHEVPGAAHGMPMHLATEVNARLTEHFALHPMSDHSAPDAPEATLRRALDATT